MGSHLARLKHRGCLDHATSVTSAPPRLQVDVPERNGNRSKRSPNASTFTRTPTHWLDWCAGKGHLGRRLVNEAQQLTCLEYDPALIEAGQQLSQRHASVPGMCSKMCCCLRPLRSSRPT